MGNATERVITILREKLLQEPRQNQGEIVQAIAREHGFNASTVKRAIDIGIDDHNIIRTGTQRHYQLEWTDEPIVTQADGRMVIRRPATLTVRPAMLRYPNGIVWGLAHCLGMQA